MVTLDTHQSQELQVPSSEPNLNMASDPHPDLNQDLHQVLKQDSGPNAITVLTLLDKLVLMLDSVQRDQHNMEVHQVQMESVVRGIQADMTKLSKSHSHTANSVSKLLDKSKKLSVTMKEVRSQMEKQEVQVKKLEANHAHLIDRNQFRVLIFQEESEIPASVFVKDQPPFPRDDIMEEGEEPEQEGGSGLHSIDLSSDEEAGLEAELEDDWTVEQNLENMEPTRAEKLKRSSLKKVDSLKKAFSKQNIEKKMNKIGTKLVSAEQRQKLKLKSPVSFGLRKSRGSVEIPVETLEAVAETRDSPEALAQDEALSVEHEEHEASLSVEEPERDPEESPIDPEEPQKDPEESQREPEELHRDPEEPTSEQEEPHKEPEGEGLSPEYSLSTTLPQETSVDPGPEQELQATGVGGQEDA